MQEVQFILLVQLEHSKRFVHRSQLKVVWLTKYPESHKLHWVGILHVWQLDKLAGLHWQIKDVNKSYPEWHYEQEVFK